MTDRRDPRKGDFWAAHRVRHVGLSRLAHVMSCPPSPSSASTYMNSLGRAASLTALHATGYEAHAGTPEDPRAPVPESWETSFRRNGSNPSARVSARPRFSFATRPPPPFAKGGRSRTTSRLRVRFGFWGVQSTNVPSLEMVASPSASGGQVFGLG